MAITDLDELVLSCRTEQARTYIQEAVGSYRAGAYRACIVATWIAVIFDLVEKVRDLALGGDAEARSMIEKYERWHKQIEDGNPDAIRHSLDFERTLIDVTQAKFEFFEPQQLLELRRLREDRNRCAHPSYQRLDTPYQPSAELARLHLRNAVALVLSQPPVQGKAAINALISTVGSDFFPREKAEAQTALLKAGLERPKEALVTAFADKLMYGLFDRASGLFGRRQTLIALGALHDLHPSSTEPRLRRAVNRIARETNDKRVEFVFAVLSHLPITANLLDADIKNKLGEFLRSAEVERVQTPITIALEFEGLRTAAEARLNSLSAKELIPVVQRSKSRAVVERAVALYCDVHQWVEANTVYESCVEPLVPHLTANDFKAIIVASVSGADLRGANSFHRLLTRIYNECLMPRAELLSFLVDTGLELEAAGLQHSLDDDIPF
ncbi:hypothetical protein [Bradyrhizobium archetypum]|uniref:Uncharacterized protein n=1 Tax=Bradyrhizobium archetypum TaxID=2721160 RepID=A0A7Y4M3V1_9BRAD|nr:hypothetical protein [Bradyrhizobium archetypum]NOJ48420.1 hypothetical protein [Bradyrhizobium archetypum]